MILNKYVFISFVLFFSLTGCSEVNSVVKSKAYYMENENERNKVLEWCSKDSQMEFANQNCINAKDAEARNKVNAMINN